MSVQQFIENRVHTLYWKEVINCAGTMLRCLGELFDVTYEPQTLHAALGMHGAGGFRAQCGLAEGALMFFGIYYSGLGRSGEEIAGACRRFAQAFTEKFGSLSCRELRPGGFAPNDPPHLCEKLTCEAARFAYAFIAGGTGCPAENEKTEDGQEWKSK